jgi:hypothetical protein
VVKKIRPGEDKVIEQHLIHLKAQEEIKRTPEQIRQSQLAEVKAQGRGEI